MEAINALTKQLPERNSEVEDGSGLIDIIRSTQENVRFGNGYLSSLLERARSDPTSVQRLAANVLRNAPVEVESPSYELLGKYEGDDKSFLSEPPLELRKYDAFRSVSVPLPSESSEVYTLKIMGAALTEIFSYLELGNNAGSTFMSMTTPFFISGNQMFVKLPFDYENNPPKPVHSSIAFDDFPETVMATLSFPGICTNQEIQRQKDKLMERIQTLGDIGWNIKQQTDTPHIFVLQYNAPGTLPWRRINEIAVVMEKTMLTDAEDIDTDDRNNIDTKKEQESSNTDDSNENSFTTDVK